MQGPDRVTKVGLTFDDVPLVPRFSAIRFRRDVDTASQFSKRIKLNIPIVSANMDTVTESGMAIAMARLEGLGVIHRFMAHGHSAHAVDTVKKTKKELGGVEVIDRRIRKDNRATKEDELVEEVIEESVPEGVEGFIPYKARVQEVVKELVGGFGPG